MKSGQYRLRKSALFPDNFRYPVKIFLLNLLIFKKLIFCALVYMYISGTFRVLFHLAPSHISKMAGANQSKTRKEFHFSRLLERFRLHLHFGTRNKTKIPRHHRQAIEYTLPYMRNWTVNSFSDWQKQFDFFLFFFFAYIIYIRNGKKNLTFLNAINVQPKNVMSNKAKEPFAFAPFSNQFIIVVSPLADSCSVNYMDDVLYPYVSTYTMHESSIGLGF